MDDAAGVHDEVRCPDDAPGGEFVRDGVIGDLVVGGADDGRAP
jgi:hypothetical protein